MDEWLAQVGDLGEEPELEMVQRFWNGSDEMPITDQPTLVRDDSGRFVLTSATPGAQIAYQLKSPGRTGDRWQVYTSPIDQPPGDTLRSVAQRIGFRESEVTIDF
jgi:hypothetical protein